MKNLKRGNQRELTAFALDYQHNVHPAICKGCNRLDSNLPAQQKDQKLFFPEIPTRLILQCPFQMQQQKSNIKIQEMHYMIHCKLGRLKGQSLQITFIVQRPTLSSSPQRNQSNINSEP